MRHIVGYAGCHLNNNKYYNEKVFEVLNITDKHAYVSSIVGYNCPYGNFPTVKSIEDLNKVIQALLELEARQRVEKAPKAVEPKPNTQKNKWDKGTFVLFLVENLQRSGYARGSVHEIMNTHLDCFECDPLDMIFNKHYENEEFIWFETKQEAEKHWSRIRVKEEFHEKIKELKSIVPDPIISDIPPIDKYFKFSD